MSEHQTAAGQVYLLEYDPEARSLTHSDLDTEAGTVVERWERYEATPLTADGYRSTPVIEVLWLPEAGRAGLACGADADWTDAASPADALERYLGIDEKELSN